MAPASPLLEVRGLSRHFGGVTATNDVSFRVDHREIVALIGPNGAGKSTLFHCISGLVQPSAGSVLWRGQDITNLPTQERVRRGIACTFQNIRLFPEMSVYENVLVGAYHELSANWAGVIRSLSGAFASTGLPVSRVDQILELVGLTDARDIEVDALSYGAKKRLELARALATKPQLILLDEPVAGMNPSERLEIRQVIERLRKTGVTIFLVEHDMQFVMNLVDRVIVMNFGQCIADNTPEAVQRDPQVLTAYLGS